MPRKPRGPVTSDKLLKDLQAISIRLESGDVVELDVDVELHVGTTPAEFAEELRVSHSRYAFWSYQETRALRDVRKQEKVLAEAEARANLIWRQYYDKHSAEYATNDMIRSRVSLESDVQSARIKLNTLRHHYDVLRAMRVAQDHRAQAIRHLARHAVDTKG